MFTRLKSKYIIYATALTIISEILYRGYLKLGKIYRENTEKNNSITDALFFTEHGAGCKEHGFSSKPCSLIECPVRNVKYEIFI